MSAIPCRVTADLNRYEREQAKREISNADYERAMVAKLHATLTRDQSPAIDYTGLELVAEAMSEVDLIRLRPIVELLASAIEGAPSLAVARDDVDQAELGRLVLDLMWPYLQRHAESSHG